jgi:adenosylcobinamide-phosphate synthase
MLLFALIAALLIEQLVPLEADNTVHAWARRWVTYTRSKVLVAHPIHVWLWWSAAVLLPVVLSVLVYQLLLTVAWPLAWLWLVGVLYLTMGFRQFSHYFSRIRDALQEGREDDALAALAQWRQVDEAEARRSDWVSRVLSLALLAAQRHVMGVWLAFVVLGALGLGPAGAVLYRMAEFVARVWRVQTEPTQALGQGAPQPADGADQTGHADHDGGDDEVAVQCALLSGQAWHYVDWLPVRMSALGFAAAGNFEGVVGAWRDAKDSLQTSNDSLLLAAGAGALHVTLQDQPAEGVSPQAASADAAQDLAVMSASLLDEQDSAAHAVHAARTDHSAPHSHDTAVDDTHTPASPAKRHVAALASLVWRVVVLAMVVLAGLTLVSWLN